MAEHPGDGNLVAELSRDFGALFDQGVDEAEHRRRVESWLAKLRAAWDQLTPEEREALADRRSWLRLFGH